jgi:alpha-tubulin suppressor-like RCC1 family protein
LSSSISTVPTVFAKLHSAELFLLVALDPTQCVIEQVAAGCEHSLAMTEDGDVWTWGHGRMGQVRMTYFA